MRIGRDKSGQQQVVYGITDAPKPLSQDIRSRESKYLMAMGIRIVAFLLIVILPIAWPWKLGLAALALVLPYVAVVYANGGREPEPGADSRYSAADRLSLLPGGSKADSQTDSESDSQCGPKAEFTAEFQDDSDAGTDPEPDPAEPIAGRVFRDGA